MARPREFDEASVLRSAMETFWSKGFEATSMTDLTDSMGVSRSSLYAAFGDKDRLFARALDLYLSDISAERVGILRKAPSVREGLRDFFEHHIRVALDPRTPLGCLVVNTALEMETVAEATAERLSSRARIGEAAVRELIERGRRAGEIDRAKNAHSLALLIVAASYGIHVMARMHRDRKTLHAIANAAIEAVC
jgi:TetR/AcrR family transcriptional regulator, transcriptional repressor for nem operon